MATGKVLMIWRREVKRVLISEFGGACMLCGYSRCPNALEFHHVDPTKKDFSISRKSNCSVNWESICSEVVNCILVCSNCHREIHYGFTTIPKNLNIVNLEILLTKNPAGKSSEELEMNYCEICGNTKLVAYKYCSQQCSKKAQRLVGWDSIDLVKLIDIDKLTFTSLAKQFNCSGKTVSKHYVDQKGGPLGRTRTCNL